MSTKICTKCNKEFSLAEFNFKNKAKNIRLSHCRYCRQEYTRSHYSKNKNAYKERSRKYNTKVIARNSQKMVEYLREHPCVDCREDDVVVLQFDHMRDKKDSISKMVRSAHSWTTILEEIDKCQVLCANCHFRKTAKEFDWKWKKSRKGGS